MITTTSCNQHQFVHIISLHAMSVCKQHQFADNVKKFSASKSLTSCEQHHNYIHSVNKPRELLALDRQGTRQQRPESPMVTPPGVRVNTRNITKGTSSKDVPLWLTGLKAPTY